MHREQLLGARRWWRGHTACIDMRGRGRDRRVGHLGWEATERETATTGVEVEAAAIVVPVVAVMAGSSRVSVVVGETLLTPPS